MSSFSLSTNGKNVSFSKLVLLCSCSRFTSQWEQHPHSNPKHKVLTVKVISHPCRPLRCHQPASGRENNQHKGNKRRQRKQPSLELPLPVWPAARWHHSAAACLRVHCHAGIILHFCDRIVNNTVWIWNEKWISSYEQSVSSSPGSSLH